MLFFLAHRNAWTESSSRRRAQDVEGTSVATFLLKHIFATAREFCNPRADFQRGLKDETRRAYAL